jgi:hypothetical protein
MAASAPWGWVVTPKVIVRTAHTQSSAVKTFPIPHFLSLERNIDKPRQLLHEHPGKHNILKNIIVHPHFELKILERIIPLGIVRL